MSNNWYYNDHPVTEIPSDMVGFVYLIHDYANDMWYVGKKLAITTRKKPPLKGRTNKRHVRVETDWRSYWGSNLALIAAVKQHGPQRFRRDILHWCRNKNQMAYLETKEQFDRRVLHDDTYYNGIIHCRITGRGLK